MKPLTLLALSFAVLGSASVPAAESKPNVVLLFADDVGWGDVRYRRDKLEWPNVDQMMRDGLCFTDAYTTSPTCSPSRASVITGQHPARVRLVRHIPEFVGARPEFSTLPADPAKMPSRNWLPLDETTIAEALHPLGYRSAFVGKWHLGDEPFFPVHQGFDEQNGVTPFGHPASYTAPFWKDCDTYKDISKGKYLDDQLTDDAVAFLERQKDAARPFFLSVFYYGAHTLWQGRADLVERFQKKGLKGGEAQQAALCAAVDESVGRVRQALARLGLADKTVVIFSGDQGSLLDKSPLRGGKQVGTALYEGSARVPLIVCWPGVVKPGRVSAEPVLTDDLLPTIVELAGGCPDSFSKLDGLSLLPLLQGKQETLGRDAVFLYRSYDDQYAAVRAGPWKLIAYRSGRAELFDVTSDLAEAHDQAAQRPELAKQLRDKLAAWETRMGVALARPIVLPKGKAGTTNK